jgi:hypothetical protein
MEMKVPRVGKIFYGWWIVLAAAVGLLFSVAPIIVFGCGSFRTTPASLGFNNLTSMIEH